MLQLPVIPLPRVGPPRKCSHSPTDFAEYLICPRRYAVRKVAPRADTPETLRGKQIHTAMEVAARVGWTRVGEEHMQGVPGPMTADKLWRWVARALTATQGLVAHRTEQFATVKVAGLEWPVNMRIDLEGERDGVPLILDWKSVGDVSRTPTEWEARRAPQARIYALTREIPVFEFVYFNDNNDARVVRVEFSDKDMADTHRWLVRTGQEIERRWRDGDWPTVLPGGLCCERYCEGWGDCYGGDR